MGCSFESGRGVSAMVGWPIRKGSPSPTEGFVSSIKTNCHSQRLMHNSRDVRLGLRDEYHFAVLIDDLGPRRCRWIRGRVEGNRLRERRPGLSFMLSRKMGKKIHNHLKYGKC